MADKDRLDPAPADGAPRFTVFGRRERSGDTGLTRISPWARLRYRFDMQLSRGPSVVIKWLGVITLIIVVLAAAIVTITGLTGVAGSAGRTHPLDAFWAGLLRILDPANLSGDTTWPARIVGLVVVLAGIFIAGSLIGLISNAIDQRIEELRKGRTLVIETDHTLILGWSSRVPAIVRELVVANESRRRAAIVVVAERDKLEMEDELYEFVGDARTTRIVCRSGEPWVPANLELANIAGARSVIVVSTGSDSATVKSLLAIRAAVGKREHAFHVVAEVTDSHTANSLMALFDEDLVPVSSEYVVAELTAQACRKHGFSVVFRELLAFEGDETYMAPFPELDGQTYAQCQLAFDTCSVMGILDASGTVALNPAPETVYAAGQELIGIAEDDSTFLMSAHPVTGSLLAAEARRQRSGARRIIMAGWSDFGPRVIAELDQFLTREDTLELLLDPEHIDAAAVRAQVAPRNAQLEVHLLAGGPEVVATHVAGRRFDEVILLGYRDSPSLDDTDARTLLTLLAFRQASERAGGEPVRIVAELLDQRNAALAEAVGADDFIVSDELTSLMLAQLSERRELIEVFRELFARTGPSIQLYDAPSYGAHQARTFADVVVSASAQGHSAIGYRVAATGKIVINPLKSAPVSLSREDEVLVIATGLGDEEQAAPLHQPAATAI